MESYQELKKEKDSWNRECHIERATIEQYIEWEKEQKKLLILTSFDKYDNLSKLINY